MSRVLFQHWWNSRYGSLARRDVIVWTTEDRGRWMVEARRGGSEGLSRFQETPTEHEALALAMRWRGKSEHDEWKDISRLIRNPPMRDAHE